MIGGIFASRNINWTRSTRLFHIPGTGIGLGHTNSRSGQCPGVGPAHTYILAVES